ncbi:hypothetical protein [Anabaena sp. FACHB-1237]|nr:hypothetical protein [Anabaena sp. FACHB-1237]
MCSKCGYKRGKLDLKIRSVKCLNCGTQQTTKYPKINN